MLAFIPSLPVPIREAIDKWTLHPGATREAIAAVEAVLSFELPADVVAFYLDTNGATGHLGETFLEIEPVEGIATRGADYDFDEVAPHLLLIGTNGGSEGFAIDKRSGACVIVPLHEPDDADLVVQGTLRAMLERVASNTQFE